MREVVVKSLLKPGRAAAVGMLARWKRRTFCFLRLQLSQAVAVRCLFSGSTLGRVMMRGREGVLVVSPLMLTSPKFNW